MCWQLVEEISCARPQKPGAEWWTLLDIALDARYETRQSMCGEAYLLQRGKCSPATLYRRLDKLQRDGLLMTVRRSAPGPRGSRGIRAIYEIPLLHHLSPLSVTETRSPVDNQAPEEQSPLSNAETRPEADGSQKAFERLSKRVRTPLSNAERHTVTNAVTNKPSPIDVLELDGPVEREPGQPDQEHHGEVIELPPRPYRPRHGDRETAAWQAAESRQLRTGGTP